MNHSSYYSSLCMQIQELIKSEPDNDELKLALKAAELNYVLAATIEQYDLEG